MGGAWPQRWLPPPGARTLWLALGGSLAFHALLLSLHFSFPDVSRALQNKALDIVLVNSKSAHRPSDAQALAQANLDGGGNSEQNRRAKTPLPAAARHQHGDELKQAEKRVRALEAQQQRLLTQARSKAAVAAKSDQQAEAVVEPQAGISWPRPGEQRAGDGSPRRRDCARYRRIQ